jgi:K+-sensing histidine kinase KdpD
MKCKYFEGEWAGYLTAAIAIALMTVLLRLFSSHINATTVALALLLVVLFIATQWGARPAVAASLLGVLGFNFFFLPPVGTLTVASPDNWVALIAFLVTAITVGHLSASARRRTEEANAGRSEIERLYKELQEAFDRASEAEALKQSEKLKSALLDAVTHDLRTPLTSIKASVTMLLEESHAGGDQTQVKLDAEDRREMLDVINEETDRLNRFIEGMVELARIEAGEMHLRRQWGAVEEIVSSALERAAPLTQRHTVEVSIEDNLPAVRLDAKAVAEVIYTLVDNAAKYSSIGSYIRVAANHNGNGAIRLIVEDQGIGIPLELRERVFDKFFRAMRDGDERKKSPMGNGMGLAIARGIVEAHRGQIWIESGSGNQGSRIVAIFPIDVSGTREIMQ